MTSTLNITIIISLLSFLILFILIFFSSRSFNYNKKLVKLYNEKKEIDELIEFNNYKSNILNITAEVKDAINNYSINSSNLKDIDNLRPIRITGRRSVDSLISSKIRISKLKDINFYYDIMPTKFNTIDDSDIIPLLGNIIDNSIEAALHSKQKELKLQIRIVKNCYVIKITNSKDITLKPLKNNFNTTKEDTLKHGLGTKIVKFIVEKHNGKISYNDKGDEFIAKIIIPM